MTATPPSPPGKITLRDLKRCRLAHVFFDTFFNIEKYLDHEQKEQVSLLRVRGVPVGGREGGVPARGGGPCSGGALWGGGRGVRAQGEGGVPVGGRSRRAGRCDRVPPCDPRAPQESETEGPELSDWERYAAEEYDLLVAEEAAGEPWDDG